MNKYINGRDVSNCLIPMVNLYFINTNFLFRLSNGHINFEKLWQLAKQVMEFLSWKQVSCPFVRNEDVLTLLQMSPVLSENGRSIL